MSETTRFRLWEPSKSGVVESCSRCDVSFSTRSPIALKRRWEKLSGAVRRRRPGPGKRPRVRSLSTSATRPEGCAPPRTGAKCSGRVGSSASARPPGGLTLAPLLAGGLEASARPLPTITGAIDDAVLVGAPRGQFWPRGRSKPSGRRCRRETPKERQVSWPPRQIGRRLVVAPASDLVDVPVARSAPGTVLMSVDLPTPGGRDRDGAVGTADRLDAVVRPLVVGLGRSRAVGRSRVARQHAQAVEVRQRAASARWSR